MKLHELSDNPGATKNRKRIGRGIGSGTGKTGGRGVKGQKARSGVAIKAYEGGQMPLHRRLPKRGFKSIFKSDYNVVAVGKLQAAVEAGRIDPAVEVTVEVLVQSGILRRAKDGVRVLGDGELTTPLRLTVAGASASAIAAVEKAGGSVTVLVPAAAAAGDAAA
jgi:large subunit ribosomal protein L15